MASWLSQSNAHHESIRVMHYLVCSRDAAHCKHSRGGGTTSLAQRRVFSLPPPSRGLHRCPGSPASSLPTLFPDRPCRGGKTLVTGGRRLSILPDVLDVVVARSSCSNRPFAFCFFFNAFGCRPSCFLRRRYFASVLSCRLVPVGNDDEWPPLHLEAVAAPVSCSRANASL